MLHHFVGPKSSAPWCFNVFFISIALLLHFLVLANKKILATLLTEMESRTQSSRPSPRPRTKKFWGHSHGQTLRPRPRTKNTDASVLQKKKKKSQNLFSGDLKKKGFKNFFSGEKGLQRSSKTFFQAISTWGNQKKKVFADFRQSF